LIVVIDTSPLDAASDTPENEHGSGFIQNMATKRDVFD
jgi:hypothetical protein